VEAHRAGDRTASDAAFHLDALRAHGDALHERLTTLARRVSEATDWELADVDEGGRLTYGTDQLPVRAELLPAIAEVAALTRALREVDDPTQHAVMITLSPLEGVGSSKVGLITSLAYAYSTARGRVEARAPSATISPRVALKVVGLSVRSFFEHEEGVHLWHTPDGPPMIAVVRVRPALPGESPEDALAALGGDFDPTLRVVRSIRYDPTRRPGPLTLEDYVMGTTRAVSASRVTDPLPALWMARMAREEEA